MAKKPKRKKTNKKPEASPPKKQTFPPILDVDGVVIRGFYLEINQE